MLQIEEESIEMDYPLEVNKLRVNDSQRINSVWAFFSQDLLHSLLRSVSGSAFFRE